VTKEVIGTTSEWSNKVELADLDGDGLVDIIFANGGDYETPGTPEPNRIFLNQGMGLPFREATQEILGPVGDFARSIKARDLNGDGLMDIVVGTTYHTQSRLYLGRGGGAFEEVTATHLPQGADSIGDLEVGDVDGDGDLDIVLADWGEGPPRDNGGARVKLWLNDGSASFADASERMPTKKIWWSWDIELIDVDNDLDLDIAASCKSCEGSSLFHNSGSGTFEDASDRLPQFTNNYEFEPIDLNGDGFFDLVTINDGEEHIGGSPFNRREHVFIADGTGGFTDGTAELWPDSENIGEDDNAVVVLDFDSDGDPDFLIASLFSGPDRLLINDGTGHLQVDTQVFDGPQSSGTLGIAVADLNGDGKLDVVQSQGEAQPDDERVYFGMDIAPDTAAPIVDLVQATVDEKGELLVRARVHDNKTPVVDFDFESVSVEVTRKGAVDSLELSWYGGSLWRLQTAAEGISALRVCAVDANANRTCSEEVTEFVKGKNDDLGEGEDGGCSAAGGMTQLFGFLMTLLSLALVRRRR
jgi:uncharacterized protein (TIGR03382 family)